MIRDQKLRHLSLIHAQHVVIDMFHQQHDLNLHTESHDYVGKWKNRYSGERKSFTFVLIRFGRRFSFSEDASHGERWTGTEVANTEIGVSGA